MKTKLFGRNAPLDSLAIAQTVIVELITLSLLWAFEPDHQIGLLYSALTLSTTLLSLVAGQAASTLKADPRPQIAARAFRARLVSLLLLLPTIFVGGGALAIKMQTRAAEEYRTSQEFVVDQQNATGKDASGNMLDSSVVSEAAAKLGRAVTPTQARMDDPAYFGGVLAYAALALLPLMAVSFARTFAPETEAQARRREEAVREKQRQAVRAAAAAKGRKTREANRKRSEKLLNKSPKIPNVLEMVRR